MKINIRCSPDEYGTIRSFAAHFFDETLKAAYSFDGGDASFVFAFNSDDEGFDAQIVCGPPFKEADDSCRTLRTEYVLRPLYYDGFKSAVTAITEGRFESGKPLVFGNTSPLYILPHSIVYCSTDGHHILLHTLDSFIPSPESRDVCRMRKSDFTKLYDDRIIRLRTTFTAAMEILSADKRFVRIRNGIAVNMEHISEVRGDEFILASGVCLKPRICDAAAIKRMIAEHLLNLFSRK